MSQEQRYAYLPEDLLMQMLEKAPQTAGKLAQSVTVNNEEVTAAREILEKGNIIALCPDGDTTPSIMAADGANIIAHKTGSDVILSIAVGVDGLSKNESPAWPPTARQYQSWLDALPHHPANARLSQGIMFLMELSILSENDRAIRIMDGSHITFILRINSLLSAKGDANADESYVNSLSDFLNKNYKKIIPNIPDMIKKAFSCDAIIGLAKFSSSREIIDSRLQNVKTKVDGGKERGIQTDDKTFFSSLLKPGEYTIPLSVGQCDKDKDMWEKAHIHCNLKIKGMDESKPQDADGADEAKLQELNEHLADAIKPFKITDDHKSELYFCYYKPYSYTSAYRLEIKKSLAEDTSRLQMFLRSIKEQIISYEIREPYPQYLADIIAKNVSFGLDAVDEAISCHPSLAKSENFDIILPYRTR